MSARVLLVTGASRGIGPRLRPARGPTGLGVIGAAASIVAASGASAATAVIDGITVNDYGRVDPAGPDFAQPGVGTGTAQIQIGQVNVMPPNPPEFSNPDWDPYGLSDTTTPGGISRASGDIQWAKQRFDHRLGLAQR